MRAALGIAAAVVALAACRDGGQRLHDPLPPGEAEQLLAERVWLDRLPRSERERFHLALFIPDGFAYTQHGTVWKGEHEGLIFDVDGDRLELFRPDSGERVTTRFRVERIEHRHADVKLILDQNPVGPREYLGFGGDGDGAGVTPANLTPWLRARMQ